MNMPSEKEIAGKEKILLEILTGLKEKFFQPLINENRRLTAAIQQKTEYDEKILSDLIQRVEQLERKVEESPVTVLSAIRDAINQSDWGENNGKD